RRLSAIEQGHPLPEGTPGGPLDFAMGFEIVVRARPQALARLRVSPNTRVEGKPFEISGLEGLSPIRGRKLTERGRPRSTFVGLPGVEQRRTYRGDHVAADGLPIGESSTRRFRARHDIRFYDRKKRAAATFAETADARGQAVLRARLTPRENSAIFSSRP